MRDSETARPGLARATLGDIPRDNPCSQCGATIARPDWIEPGRGRVSYLWTCRACGYRFEAIAIFDQAQQQHPPLAA